MIVFDAIKYIQTKWNGYISYVNRDGSSWTPKIMVWSLISHHVYFSQSKSILHPKQNNKKIKIHVLWRIKIIKNAMIVASGRR